MWPADVLFVQTNGDEMKAGPIGLANNQIVMPNSEHVWKVELEAP